MATSPSRDSGISKAVTVLAGLGIAVGLAMAAPGHAASPSTAAARIVAARHHDRPGGDSRDDQAHRPGGHPGRHSSR